MHAHHHHFFDEDIPPAVLSFLLCQSCWNGVVLCVLTVMISRCRAIQNFTDVESTLTSAERMLHFTRLPAEGDNVPQDKDFEESEKTVERVSAVFFSF